MYTYTLHVMEGRQFLEAIQAFTRQLPASAMKQGEVVVIALLVNTLHNRCISRSCSNDRSVKQQCSMLSIAMVLRAEQYVFNQERRCFKT